MKNRRSLSMLVAILGVLTVGGAAVFNTGFAGQTLASWTDRVLGTSTFAVDAPSMQGYSQSLSGRFYLARTTLGDRAWEGVAARRSATSKGTTNAAEVSHSSGTGLDILRVHAKSAACSTYLPSSPACMSSSSDDAVARATSQLRDFKLTVKPFAVTRDLAWSESGKSFGMIASCPTDGAPTAGLAPGGADGIYLRRDSAFGAPLHLQLPREPSNGQTTRSTMERIPGSGDLGFNYNVVIGWHKNVTSRSAVSELRMRITTVSAIGNVGMWEFDMILGYAACGIGESAPALPTARATAPQTLTTMMSRQQEATVCAPTDEATRPEEGAPLDDAYEDVRDESAAPMESFENALLEGEGSGGASTGVSAGEPTPEPCEPDTTDTTVMSPIELLVEDGVIGESEPRSELADREEEPKNIQLAPDTSTGDAESEKPATSGPSDSDEGTVGVHPDRDNEDTRASENTETVAPSRTPSTGAAPSAPPTPILGGPTSPSRVSTGVPFAMIATDGSSLATVTIEDISRSTGCVAILLEVTTADGSGSSILNGLRAGDFREVLPDGGTAPVGAPTGTCDAGTSLPTSFEPNTFHSGWVTFDVVNGGTAVMLRPIGTAGWIIDLPAAPTPPVVAPVVTSPPESEGDTSDAVVPTSSAPESESAPQSESRETASTAPTSAQATEGRRVGGEGSHCVDPNLPEEGRDCP